jgi:hypothetical protein
MAKAGGGFTFIPREAVKQGKLPNLINQIFTQKSQVLLRFQNQNGLQPFTLITQLPYYSKQPLGVLMHNYAGYTCPKNAGLGDYIFLGIIPAIKAKAQSLQGFRYFSPILPHFNARELAIYSFYITYRPCHIGNFS